MSVELLLATVVRKWYCQLRPGLAVADSHQPACRNCFHHVRPPKWHSWY